MRIVITGANGFIGGSLLSILSGHEVFILTRPDSKVVRKDAQPCRHFIYKDLLDPLLIGELKAWEPDVFMHLAWKGVAGASREQDFQFTENILFTLDSVRLAHICGCRKWIGAGSQAEYGIANKPVTENEACNPVTPYGTAKLAAGIAALGLCKVYGMSGVWTRIFSVYGPGDHSKTFINYTVSSLLNNTPPSLSSCTQIWDYLFVSDASKALIALADSEAEGIFNIGSGEAICLQQVSESIRKLIGTKVPVAYNVHPDGPLKHLQADVSKLKSATGWQPEVSLLEGLERTIDRLKETSNESF